MRRGLMILSLLAVIAAACTGTGGITPATTVPPDPTDPAPTTNATTTTTLPPTTTTTEPQPPPCPDPVATQPRPGDGGPDPGTPDAPALASLRVSRATFSCSPAVVLAAPDDLEVAALAARLAAGLGAPLLLTGGPSPEPLEAEIRRLAPARVLVIGDATAPWVPEWTAPEPFPGERALLAEAIARELDLTATVPMPAEPGAGTVAALARSLADAAVPVPTTGGEDPTAATGPGEVIVGSGTRGAAWLVSRDDPLLALAPMAAAATSGDLAALVDPGDLRRNLETARALQAGRADVVSLLGGFPDAADWQLPVITDGTEIPGGGYLLFPGRRIVALYGNPIAPVLGVMGEQPPPAAAALAIDTAAPYAEEGVVVVPAFEIIATVADSRAGGDGNYSNEMEIEVIRPWVDQAAADGLYVLLDLQPGRTDFLTQAQQYEELLREPHVGLALDPEWRLGPDQVHLKQFGSVTAAEINQVADWLAGLVRDHHLPQKMLLLHQFRLSMLPDRFEVQVGPELALVIQMDGQGPLQTKYETWAAITSGTEETGWWWGWKNFYDEDSPTATPEQVLEIEPNVVYVSYQ